MKGQKDRFSLRILDENHPDDWIFFLVIGLVCNIIYFIIFIRFDVENGMFPIGLIGFNLITPVAMFFCELGERSIYG